MNDKEKKKKETERFYLENFLLKRTDLATALRLQDFQAQILDMESPDFLIQAPKDLLGVELSNLYCDHFRQGKDLMLNQITSFAQEIFEKKVSMPLKVRLEFSQPFRCEKDEKDHYAALISDFVHQLFLMEMIPGNFDIVFDRRYRTEMSGLYLPKFLQSVRIKHKERWTGSLWFQGESYFDAEVLPALLEKRLTKKEKRIPTYRTKCEELWLLLILWGGIDADASDLNFLQSMSFDSSFDRIFLYAHNGLGNVVEIRTL